MDSPHIFYVDNEECLLRCQPECCLQGTKTDMGESNFLQTCIGKNEELRASRNFKDDRVINDTIVFWTLRLFSWTLSFLMFEWLVMYSDTAVIVWILLVRWRGDPSLKSAFPCLRLKPRSWLWSSLDNRGTWFQMTRHQT